jgi:hypothetical protein
MPQSFTAASTARALEADLRARRALHLPVSWADELVYPAYDGLSIVNLPHTVADRLGAPLPGSQPIDSAIWGGTPPDVDRVVLFVSDGLGYLYLQQLIETDTAVRELVARLTDGRGPLPLTSVAPSTTAVALPSIWTGAPPAAHGMLGTSLYLREIWARAIVLFFATQVGKSNGPGMGDVGLDPRTFVPVAGLGAQLAGAGIPSHVVLLKDFIGSGLSLVLHRGVEHFHPHTGHSDFWLRVHDALAATNGQRAYINIYCGGVDTVSHAYGAHNRYTHHEIRDQLQQLAALLDDPALHDGRTLFMMTADHGHHDAVHMIDLATDPRTAGWRDAVRMGTGDMRMSYLYLEAGSRERVMEAIARDFADTMTAIPAEDALAAGLFGPPPWSPETRSRLGDLVLVTRLGSAVLDSRQRFPKLVSHHAGLDAFEMLVPLLWRTL